LSRESAGYRAIAGFRSLPLIPTIIITAVTIIARRSLAGF
jgi:hypothetical protein